MKTITHNNITWIDIERPTQEDIDFLKKEFGLSERIVQEFLPPIKRPKIEIYQNCLWLVLHFPVFDRKKRQTKQAEIDFIVTPNVLITSHYQEIPDLARLFEECASQLLAQEQYFKTANQLFLKILDFLIDAQLPMLDHIHEHIDNIEEQVFQGKEKEMLSEISIVKRDIIDFRRTIKPQRLALKKMTEIVKETFNENLDYLLREIIDSNFRIWHVLENHKEMIEAIEETNNSLLSYKINEVVKVLTLLSFVTFPLGVIVGFFGMNVFPKESKIINPYTWLIILAAILFVTLLMIMYFKRKKWF